MKKLFFVFSILLFSVSGFSQRTLIVDVVRGVDSLFWADARKVTGVSNDVDLSFNDSLKLVTEYAVRQFVINQLAAGSGQNIYNTSDSLVQPVNLTIDGFKLTFVQTSKGDVDFSKGITVRGIDFHSGESTDSSTVVIGSDAALNVISADNVIIGKEAGYATTNTGKQVFIGARAGKNNTTGGFSVYVGYEAGRENTTGLDNTIIGHIAGQHNQTGNFNTYLSYGAGRYHLNTDENVFSGWGCGYGPFDDNGLYNEGAQNYFGGYQSGFKWHLGDRNTLLGYLCGEWGNGAFDNVATGFKAGWKIRDGDNNTFIGAYSGEQDSTGVNNAFVGSSSGSTASGSNGTILGANVQPPVDTASNFISIGIGNGDKKIEWYEGLMELNGKVGIGDGFSPSYQLDVKAQSNTIFRASYDANPFFAVNRTGGTGIDMVFGNSAERMYLGLMNGANDLSFRTSNAGIPTSLLVNYVNGNVAIGHDTPTAKLHVVGGAKIDSVLSLVPTPNVPVGNSGNTYMDDGTNTSSGNPELRINDGNGWRSPVMAHVIHMMDFNATESVANGAGNQIFLVPPELNGKTLNELRAKAVSHVSGSIDVQIHVNGVAQGSGFVITGTTPNAESLSHVLSTNDIVSVFYANLSGSLLGMSITLTIE